MVPNAQGSLDHAESLGDERHWVKVRPTLDVQVILIDRANLRLGCSPPYDWYLG
jgi:hypothetical protein